MRPPCLQALEEGEDVFELAERNREKKDRRATNKLLRDTESGAGTPMSDGRGRGRKGKAKAVEDFEPVNGKRKRGIKSMSVTPSVQDDDDDDRDSVRCSFPQSAVVGRADLSPSCDRNAGRRGCPS